MEGDRIIMSQKDLNATVHFKDPQGNPVSVLQKMGVSTVWVELDTFINFYEDDLKDDLSPTNILETMKTRKFYHPVTFVEIDKGYIPFIQKLIDEGIVL